MEDLAINRVVVVTPHNPIPGVLGPKVRNRTPSSELSSPSESIILGPFIAISIDETILRLYKSMLSGPFAQLFSSG